MKIEVQRLIIFGCLSHLKKFYIVICQDNKIIIFSYCFSAPYGPLTSLSFNCLFTKEGSRMEGTLYFFLLFRNRSWLLTSIMVQKLIYLCKTFRKYIFRHAKGKSLANFDNSDALGENWENSESCPILRLLWRAKICNFRKFVKNGHVWTTQWPSSS